jgi:hypothetical protein
MRVLHQTHAGACGSVAEKFTAQLPVKRSRIGKKEQLRHAANNFTKSATKCQQFAPFFRIRVAANTSIHGGLI